ALVGAALGTDLGSGTPPGALARRPLRRFGRCARFLRGRLRLTAALGVRARPAPGPAPAPLLAGLGGALAGRAALALLLGRGPLGPALRACLAPSPGGVAVAPALVAATAGEILFGLGRQAGPGP